MPAECEKGGFVYNPKSVQLIFVAPQTPPYYENTKNKSGNKSIMLLIHWNKSGTLVGMLAILK